MKYTELLARVSGRGADAWKIHYTAAERQRSGEPIILLTIGQEASETTPPVIVDAVIDSLRQGRHHYSEISGEPNLRQALSQHYTQQLGTAVSPDNCAFFAGAQNALFAASLCTLERGDEAILIEPYYATYPATFSAGGAELSFVATLPENDFIPSVEDIERKITGRTRAIVINSPQNPTGVVYEVTFMQHLIELCQRHQLWLISDEVYVSLVEPGQFQSPASLPEAFERCITISSLSKSHRMPGWRLGWIVAQEDLVARLFNLSLCMAYGLPMFIQDAAVTALRHSDEIGVRVRREVNQKRNRVIAMLEQSKGIIVRGSKAGMFVTFDVRNLNISAVNFAWRLLDEYQVAVLPCRAFGASGRGILRINTGDTEENLTAACERIADLSRKIQASGKGG